MFDLDYKVPVSLKNVQSKQGCWYAFTAVTEMLNYPTLVTTKADDGSVSSLRRIFTAALTIYRLKMPWCLAGTGGPGGLSTHYSRSVYH